jgi:hypothetical protein
MDSRGSGGQPGTWLPSRSLRQRLTVEFDKLLLFDTHEHL